MNHGDKKFKYGDKKFKQISIFIFYFECLQIMNIQCENLFY